MPKLYSDERRRALAAEARGLGQHGTTIVGRREKVPPVTLRRWAREFFGGAPHKGGTAPLAPPPAADAPVQPDETLERDVGRTTMGLRLEHTTASIETEEQLLAHCRIDPAVWSVERMRIKAYQGFFKDKLTGRGHTVQMFSITADLKKKVAVVDARAEIDALVADARERLSSARAPLILPRRRPPTENLLLVGPPDAHFGKLAWPEETGGGAYDLKIAERLYDDAIESLVARSAHARYDQAVFVVGNDMLHADNPEGTTTKGTRLDVDGRHAKVFRTVRRAITRNVERVRDELGCPVLVVVVEGNHDRNSMLHMGEVLDAAFDRDPLVSVDCRPRARKYHRYGRNLFMFNHGDKRKAPDLAGIMADEADRLGLWAGSVYREVFVGHLHTRRTVVDEVRGVMVRYLSSLGPADAWHAQEGYVGNRQAAEAFHYHAHDGLVGTAVYYHQPDARDGLVALPNAA